MKPVELEGVAKECGFDNCGIIFIEKMEGFKDRLNERIKNVPAASMFYGSMETFEPIAERFPWAKSLIVCTYEYNRYRYPSDMRGRYAKAYFLTPEKGHSDGFDRTRFENLLKDKGLRLEGQDAFPLRYAAMQAGLGIIRNNNFFYTEKGSYVGLTGYVTDFEKELIHETNIRPCSDTCGLCRKACKTQALSAPYTMDPTRCVSFWTTFGKGNIPEYLEEAQFEEWLCGCDNCQDICPYNRRKNWDEGEKFSDLDEIAPNIIPEKLLHMSDEYIEKEVIPKTDDHLDPGDSMVLRKNAERAIRYKSMIDNGSREN